MKEAQAKLKAANDHAGRLRALHQGHLLIDGIPPRSATGVTDWTSFGLGHYELERTAEILGIVWHKNGGDWNIPETLSALALKAEKDEYLLPHSDLVVKVPLIKTRPHRTKDEMENVGKPKRNVNIRTQNEQGKKKKRSTLRS